MSITSFIDDNSILGKAFIERDYSEINNLIKKNKDNYEYFVNDDEQVYALSVSKNESLSKIYNSEFKVVRIVLKDVDTMHKNNQEDHFEKMYKFLYEYMGKNPAYYNIRIPTHFVDAIKAYNKVFKKDVFCGGTVEWVGANKRIDIQKKDDVDVIWADSEYITKYREEMLKIAFASFEQYQGQYHVSDATASKAGVIYQKWLENAFDNYEGNVLVIAIENKPIAFLMIRETEHVVDGVISAVDSNYRKYGAYRLMISSGINYATNHKKIFVTSTQFDNYIVQGVWASLGLKPFYSIYNIHCDRR